MNNPVSFVTFGTFGFFLFCLIKSCCWLLQTERQTQTDVESGIIRTKTRRYLQAFLSRTFLEAFTLTFLAEWGDRSQIATIILAAREEVIGVILGGTIGHALCTGLAVLGGRLVSQRISMRTGMSQTNLKETCWFYCTNN